MTDEPKSNPSVNKGDAPNTASSQKGNSTPQDLVQKTHTTLTDHFKKTSSKDFNAPTYATLHNDAETAREQIKNLDTTIKNNTPEGPVATVMKNDRQNLETAEKDLPTSPDPTAVYGSYALTSVSQPDNQSVINDAYTISEGKKEQHIDYNLTDRNTGGIATASNNNFHILGANITEQTYSYTEKNANNKTTITTTHTERHTRAADSENIHLGNNHSFSFENTTTGEYTYNKDKKLISTTTHRKAEGTFPSLCDSQTTAQKGKDLSTQDTTAHKESTTIEARKGTTTFSYLKTNKKGEFEEFLTGDLNTSPKITPDNLTPNETYTLTKNGRYTYVAQSIDKNGNTIYTGYTGKINTPLTAAPSVQQITDREPLKPSDAERHFSRLQKDTNHHIKNLTGANNMGEYSNQLGTAQNHHDLGAMFNTNSTLADATAARQGNDTLNAKYNNTPELKMNINGEETIIPTSEQANLKTSSPKQAQPEPPTLAQISQLRKNQGR